MFAVSQTLFYVLFLITTTIQITLSQNITSVNGTNANSTCTEGCGTMKAKSGTCNTFTRCEPINGTWGWDPVTETRLGEWKEITCPGGLVWNEEAMDYMGSCEDIEKMENATRMKFKMNDTCFPQCRSEELKDPKERCNGSYLYFTRNESQKLLQPLTFNCPPTLIFNLELETCTRCSDLSDGETKRACCNGTGNSGNSSARAIMRKLELYKRKLQEDSESPKQKLYHGNDYADTAKDYLETGNDNFDMGRDNPSARNDNGHIQNNRPGMGKTDLHKGDTNHDTGNNNDHTGKNNPHIGSKNLHASTNKKHRSGSGNHHGGSRKQSHSGNNNHHSENNNP